MVLLEGCLILAAAVIVLACIAGDIAAAIRLALAPPKDTDRPRRVERGAGGGERGSVERKPRVPRQLMEGRDR